MSDPVSSNPAPKGSAGSVLGALLLGLLGVGFLLSTGCFGVFGIAFLADGNGAAIVLVLMGIGMGILTFFTFKGARRLYLGTPQSLVPSSMSSEEPAATKLPPESDE